MLPSFKVVIPARYGSNRLPGKPLLDIGGKPMIERVCETALLTGREVFVATDDSRICDAVRHLPVQAIMTNPDHTSGTERIAEVASRLNWQPDEIIVNLQGDEPLVDARLITGLANRLSQQKLAGIATLATPILETADLFNPNCVKVALNKKGYALYFSRAPIPWDREHFPGQTSKINTQKWLRHIGIYAYSAHFLKCYTTWERSPLETVESLEQLRILWEGEPVAVLLTDSAPPAGVDTEEDLTRVRSLFSHH